MDKVNLADKFGKFDDHWRPRILSEFNGQQVRVAKLQGEFVWHDHADEDELFFVVKGELTMKLRDRDDVVIGPGEYFIVPRGVEHKPIAPEEVHVMLIEPASTRHTGEVESERTVHEFEWI